MHIADPDPQIRLSNRPRVLTLLRLVSFPLNSLCQPSPFTSYLTTSLYSTSMFTGHLYYGLLCAEYITFHYFLFPIVRLPCLRESRSEARSKGTQKPTT